MKTKKRNGFWTLCFSFVPGCAEMYWGYMQMGMSLLLPFMLMIMMAALLHMEEIIFLDVIIYVYAFFHARNMAHMSEEEVSQTADAPIHILEGIVRPMDIIQGKKASLAAGILLIVFGAYSLLKDLYIMIPMSAQLNSIFRNILDFIPQVAAGIAVILLGVWLIKGKKKELDMELLEDKQGA
ncbi:MAG: hypothetical protein K5686_06805 [Lachnospiraceae bacterium]|nr:hypothetical protein [Lachnospiraceae bacterium]